MFGKIYQSLGRAAYLIERESCDYLKQHVQVSKRLLILPYFGKRKQVTYHQYLSY